MSESRNSSTEGWTSWVETDLDALSGNLRFFRGHLAPGTRIAAVVKANAYGHGVELVAPEALRSGADLLAVISVEEGLALRAGLGPEPRILVLGHVPLAAIGDAVRAGLELTVYDARTVGEICRAAAKTDRAARTHLKIETGTHRQGVAGEELLALARRIEAEPGIELVGLSTHFADIEDTTDHRFARGQIESFRESVADVERLTGRRPELVHCACSAAALLFPETGFDMVRLGIALYGLWPSRETLVSARERGLNPGALRPVMSWKARVAQVKRVARGSFAGYGRTWRATRDARIAVVPVGYYEGYDRALSGRGQVLCGGGRCPVVGRICMNMMLVDVTDAGPVAAGDEVVLLGASGDEQISAEDLAEWAGTIHYETVSRIHPSLPRVARGGPPTISGAE